MTTTTTTRPTPRRTRWALAGLVLATTVSGAAVATSAPAFADTSSPAASASAAVDVGIPADGIAGSGTPAIAPDGAPVAGFSATHQAPATAPSSRRIGTAADGAKSPQASILVTIAVNGARLRASVPSGPVLALAYTNYTAWASCKITGSDGYAWGWMDLDTPQGWRWGWMRQALWYVTQTTSPGGGNGLGRVPSC
jgi:hypothetical protein